MQTVLDDNKVSVSAIPTCSVAALVVVLRTWVVPLLPLPLS